MTTDFIDLVRMMRDQALQMLNGNRPALHVGCWYGDDGNAEPHPAAIICLPPDKEGNPIEAVLEIHQDALDTIAPDALHEFISRWRQYAQGCYLRFETSDDFALEDGRWQIVEE
jgi:hypothetical protein